jgi:hypothetical protein
VRHGLDTERTQLARRRRGARTRGASAPIVPRLAPGADRVLLLVVVRGDPASREFIAFWLDRVVAGMNVGVWDVTDHIQSLIRTRATVDDRRHADTDVPVEDLALTAEAGAA